MQVVTALPEEIILPAVEEHWHIAYQASDRLMVGPLEANCLAVMGPLEEPDLIMERVIDWLKVKAERHFSSYLRRLSEAHNLHYERLIIRGQRTRWGSCSSDGVISLNYKLLFLSSEVARYVLIHELCHTKHLNHSKAFWKLVAQLEPDYKRLDRMSRAYEQQIPVWIEG